ncbi:MAG TPA: IS21 family transposase [Longimicrobiales bacterium]|nr:IS21 family transposase [Longimicrobiales bacterium]
MAAERLSMRKVREVLRLHALGHSRRDIGRSVGISHNTAGFYIQRAELAGLLAGRADALDDAQLEERMFPPPPGRGALRPLPDWAEVHRELRRKGVTLQLLWSEYKAVHPDGVQYTQFVTRYRAWEGALDPVLRLEHRGGEKGFVDYAGQTLPIIDPETGEIHEAQLFVGVLGASNRTFAELTWGQTLPEWCGSHVRMYAYFGGVPELTVPDNLKSGVRRASYYEPDINPTYLELARHYGTTVLPTRTGAPRDKAKVETAVQIAERWILAALRNHTFHSLAEANEEVARLLEVLNNRPFQKLEGTRMTRFEELDRPALRPLPDQPYVYAEWKKARVNIDYHVEIGRHHYSVPHTLLRKTVDVSISATAVEIFHAGRRVAAHPRSHRVGGFTTEAGHRPLAHQRHLEWSPERLVRWATTVGSSAGALVQRILESKPHPEQGYRSCLGLMRLGKQYGVERLEAACFRALRSGATTYRSVHSILKNGLDRVPLTDQAELELPAAHENVRGPSYYNI